MDSDHTPKVTVGALAAIALAVGVAGGLDDTCDPLNQNMEKQELIELNEMYNQVGTRHYEDIRCFPRDYVRHSNQMIKDLTSEEIGNARESAKQKINKLTDPQWKQDISDQASKIDNSDFTEKEKYKDYLLRKIENEL